MHADLQRLIADELLADFDSRPIDRLRAIRLELSAAEGDVSFVRRVTQGRLDILGHEVDRRRNDPTGAAGADTPSTLLFDMPDILADRADGPGPSRLPGGGRPIAVLEPGPIALSLVEILDRIASPGQLSGIQSVDVAELSDRFGALREFELELSSIRRQLHDRIDIIQDEIARRYRDGEASVDSLLR